MTTRCGTWCQRPTSSDGGFNHEIVVTLSWPIARVCSSSCVRRCQSSDAASHGGVFAPHGFKLIRLCMYSTACAYTPQTCSPAHDHDHRQTGAGPERTQELPERERAQLLLLLLGMGASENQWRGVGVCDERPMRTRAASASLTLSGVMQ